MNPLTLSRSAFLAGLLLVIASVSAIAAVKAPPVTVSTLKKSRPALFDRNGAFVGLLEVLSYNTRPQPSLAIAIGGGYVAIPVGVSEVINSTDATRVAESFSTFNAFEVSYFRLVYSMENCQGQAYIAYSPENLVGPRYGMGVGVALHNLDAIGRATVFYSTESISTVVSVKSSRFISFESVQGPSLVCSNGADRQLGYKLSGITQVPIELIPGRIS